MTTKQTDPNYLDYRIYVHNNFSKNDFDSWVIDTLNLKSGQRVLDVGCGTGKHLFKIEEIVGNKGYVVGVDISADALSKCQDQINARNSKNIRLYNSDHTTISEIVKEDKFDRVLSSFAIYYTKNPNKTFKDLYDLLKKDGSLFVCGPTTQNNLEFLELVKKAGGKFSDDFSHWSKFLDQTARKEINQIFGNLEVLFFENPIEFPSEEVLYKYWEATATYDPKIKDNFAKVVSDVFKDKKTFTTNKIIIGLKAVKQ